MATLKDSFLADLDSLSDHEDDDNMEQDLVGDQDDLDFVSKLQKSQRFTDMMQKLEAVNITEGVDLENNDDDDDHPEYVLIKGCNALSIEIDNEIAILHKFIFDRYSLKFRGLDSLVPHPVDYARVVKRIGNEIDLNHVDLGDLLPSKVYIIVSIAATSANVKPLPENVLQKTVEACDRVITLDSAKKKLLDFLESRMRYIAPNLSAVVGTAIGAKLVCSVGGLAQLAKKDKSTIQLIGAKKKNLAGFSSATSQLHIGYLQESEIFQNTAPAFRNQAGRFLAAKSMLAARHDLFTKGDLTGSYGTVLRDEICTKINKLQELPPARQIKPLPVPDLKTKKKRGGERSTKRKKRYASTEMQKQANRMPFGVAEESSLGDGLGFGYGMLGQVGSGKLRSSVSQSRPAARVAKKQKHMHQSGGSGTRGGGTSGLTSSLAFTPVQGIELLNPQVVR